MKFFIGIICAAIIPATAFAGARESVAWSGLIYDSPSTHTTIHGHALSFEDAETKKTYGVVDSPELERLHHETNKNYQVKLEGRITPKFLFFGGNLIVTKFEILSESEEIALNTPPARALRASERP
jgi:hypothetical protein